jgi:hypothetical protein
MGLPFEKELIVEGDYRIESGYRAGHAPSRIARTGFMWRII